MENEIVLTRKLTIDTWRIKGAVAKAQKRKDVMLVLQFLNEFKTGKAKKIASHLLFDTNARLMVAQRLLDICQIYELVDSDKGNYQLTNSGKEALQANEVFIPEDGCWELSVANDPLLPHSVIKLSPFNEPNAITEVMSRNAKDNQENGERKIEDTPDWFQKFIAVELKPYEGGKSIRIDKVEQKAEWAEVSFHLSLEWNVGKNSIRILDGKKVTTQLKGPSLKIDNVWKNLLENEGILECWDELDKALAIPFDESKEHSRITMVSDYEFIQPTIHIGYQYLGDFDDVLIKGISVCAATPEDAQAWAQWRLDNSITSFASEAKYRQWVENAQKPFKKHAIKLPDRDEAAHDRIGEKYTKEDWFLLAASDWAL